jgi:hypothetical protein
MASGVKVRPRLPSLSAVTDSLLSPTLNMQALCLRFSTSWNEPHFEKPLVTQAQAIQVYSRAYGEWHSPEDLAAAQNIQGYVRHFLTNSDGAFNVGREKLQLSMVEIKWAGHWLRTFCGMPTQNGLRWRSSLRTIRTWGSRYA